MTLERWLGRRVPPVPGEVRSLLADGMGDEPEGVEALVAQGRIALERALAPEGRPRGGAFDLLVADALVTWASADALALEDAEDRLERLVRSLAG